MTTHVIMSLDHQGYAMEGLACSDPSPGEVRLRHTAIGVNFADTYHRSGISHPWKVDNFRCDRLRRCRHSRGSSEGVTTLVDKVVWYPTPSSYAETRNYPADKLLHMPDGLEDKQVAALLMKGMTAHYLLHRTYAVQPGDTIVVHAAAGMGLILCQWAKALGATIVGTVSTHEKAEAAAERWCHHA